MKLFCSLIVSALSESLISGTDMTVCSDDMCLKVSRTPGMLVCADETQNAINKFKMGMWYEAGIQCISTMYKWFAANGELFRIKGDQLMHMQITTSEYQILKIKSI